MRTYRELLDADITSMTDEELKEYHQEMQWLLLGLSKHWDEKKEKTEEKEDARCD